MRWMVRVVGAVVLGGVLGVGSASARPVSVHLSFRSAGEVWSVSATARYVFIEKSVGRDVGGTLLDEATGRRTMVVRPGCRYSAGPVSGSSWLVFDCNATPNTTSTPAPELYSMVSGSWHGVTPSRAIADPCAPNYSQPGGCDEHSNPGAAGRNWLEYSVGNCPGVHCSSRPEFQNLQSGVVRGKDPTGGSSILDLNSPSLSRRLCSPLRVPRYYDIFSGFGPGAVVPDGKFAIALGTDNSGIGLIYLERCATHLHRLLTEAPYTDPPPPWAANSTSVVWQSERNELAGVFLPSLRRFTIRLPAAALPSGCQAPDFRTCFTEIALTARHLYLLNTSGGLWTSKSPSGPKSKATVPKP